MHHLVYIHTPHPPAFSPVFKPFTHISRYRHFCMLAFACFLSVSVQSDRCSIINPLKPRKPVNLCKKYCRKFSEKKVVFLSSPPDCSVFTDKDWISLTKKPLCYISWLDLYKAFFLKSPYKKHIVACKYFIDKTCSYQY